MKLLNMECCEDTNCIDVGKICLPKTDLPRVVVIGGGFAGLALVNKLRKQKVQIILLDKNNYHQFLPLLYQVATSGTEADSILFPYRKIFANYHNVTFRMAEVTRIETKTNTVITNIGSIEYNFLVVAGGSTNNFYGSVGFERFGLSLKTVVDSLDIRSKLLQNLELAAVTCIQEEKEFLSSIAIVGGGPAGVELAGALAEFKKYIFRKDYPELQNIEMKVMLIEAKDRLLPDMPDKLSKKTLTYLKQLKVDVRANTSVKSYDGRVLTLDNGESLKAAAFIWTAGVKGTTINGLPEMAINRQSRVIVDEFSRVLPLDRVFAIGDVAQMTTKDYPEGHPMIAQPAIQQGKALADNIIRSIQEKQLMPFQYRDKGSLATVGMKKAVAIIFGRAFSGFIAWVIWSAVHLMSIIGVRNKLVIAVNWAWSYFTYDKGDRVIIHVNNK